MQYIYKLDKFFDEINKAALYIAAVLIAVLLFGVLYGAIARLVMDQPPFWPDPLTSYALYLATVFAAPKVLRDGQHIVVDALIKSVSKKLARLLLLQGLVICAATCAIMGIYAAKVTGIAIENGYLDVRAISVPFWILTAPLSFCFVMMAIESVRKFFVIYFQSQDNNK